MNYRIILFVLAFAFGIIFSIPSLTQSESGKKITLGLDLQGGLHMLLGVKTEVALHSKIKSISTALQYAFEDQEIIIDKLTVSKRDIPFEILDEDDAAAVEKILSEYEGLNLQKRDLTYNLTMS